MTKLATERAFLKMELIFEQSPKFLFPILRSTLTQLPTVFAKSTRSLCNYNARLPNVRLHETYRSTPNYFIRSKHDFASHASQRVITHDFYKTNIFPAYRCYSTDQNKDCYGPIPTPKPTVFERMKQMTKDYWYILIPFHVATSIGWIGLFYVSAKNGVDLVAIMEYLKLSERYLEILRNSSAGDWALAYALYKICTPIRYTVTVGGTTLSIRYLNKWGYLKPKPPSDKEVLSSKCATEHKEKYSKTEVKNEQQAGPPKS